MNDLPRVDLYTPYAVRSTDYWRLTCERKMDFGQEVHMAVTSRTAFGTWYAMQKHARSRPVIQSMFSRYILLWTKMVAFMDLRPDRLYYRVTDDAANIALVLTQIKPPRIPRKPKEAAGGVYIETVVPVKLPVSWLKRQ